MNTSQISQKAEGLGPWFQNLDLKGVRTAPAHFLGDYPADKFSRFSQLVPADLTGKSVLDIGCNAGFYSFELARRGAQVTALDVEAHYLAQANWAARQFGLTERIEFLQRQVYDLATTDRKWDWVLFMGVFYHLRYPMLGLDIVSRCVGKQLIFQCLSMPGGETQPTPPDLGLLERELLTQPSWPKMAFIEKRLAGDRTNWWAPNDACIEALLRSSGLAVRARPAHEVYLCEPAPDVASNMWLWNEEEYWAAVGRKPLAPAGPVTADAGAS
jgi:tRNA (mo5U34)-methyltransferase